jgi:3-O-alpha-D-mannopyranosyl-alpha-D-mannopyranose xylosylphosphotransferase
MTVKVDVDLESVYASSSESFGGKQHAQSLPLSGGNGMPQAVFPDPALYKAFRPAHDLPTAKGRDWITTLRPTRFLPEGDGCLEQWFVHGEICDVPSTSEPTSSQPLGPEETLDVIYLWVNGTDPIWQRGETKAKEQNPRGPQSAKKHFRERGELKYTLRSARQAFQRSRNTHVRKVHVVTADMPLPQPQVGGIPQEHANELADKISRWRVGQIPHWLRSDAADAGQVGVPELQWHFHSEIFRLPSEYMPEALAAEPWAEEKPKGARWRSENEWKELAMPTFNSFGIEIMLGWLDDLADFA